jgi:hypothetical protein
MEERFRWDLFEDGVEEERSSLEIGFWGKVEGICERFAVMEEEKALQM